MRLKMELVFLIISLCFVITLVYFFLKKDIDEKTPSNATKDEAACLMHVKDEWKDPILNYLRTYEASQELQDYIASEPKLLKSLDKFNRKRFGIK